MARALPISKKGDYRLRVIGAHDSYKIKPEDKEDPTKGRRIGLRLQVVDAILNNTLLKPWRGGEEFSETEDDLMARRDQVGNISSATIFLSAKGKDGTPFNNSGKVLSRALKFLVTIAGLDDIPPATAEKFFVKMENGSPLYNMEGLVEDIHINCSSMMGRDFYGRVEKVDKVKNGQWENVYPRLNSFLYKAVPDYDQPEWDGTPAQSGHLHQGEDLASQDYKDFLASRSRG